ncbi:MAG: non-heme iron oxygenase ferredoxin subunit [Actinobacteria bacterium]|nr:non-heme iron oxygenase ferredoxin subunit [Actinomycetota bacterium]
MSRWERLCAASDVPDGEARRFVVDGHPVAVVRIADDVYAIGDTCSHQKISLSEGDVHPETRELECWKHGSTFSLETGRPSCLPATRPVPLFSVKVEGDDLVVEVP